MCHIGACAQPAASGQSCGPSGEEGPNAFSSMAAEAAQAGRFVASKPLLNVHFLRATYASRCNIHLVVDRAILKPFQGRPRSTADLKHTLGIDWLHLPIHPEYPGNGKSTDVRHTGQQQQQQLAVTTHIIYILDLYEKCFII